MPVWRLARRATFTATIFVSALLLFLVQPMAAKSLLPHFGGSSAVWNASMLFFQVMLLAGYVYAHLLASKLRPRAQIITHAGVILGAAILLPLVIEVEATAALRDHPVWVLLGTLLAGLGLPFFAVSTTSPLIQKWFSHTDDSTADDPYYLYAASNAGSLLALLAYPFLIERLLDVAAQGVMWTAGYGLFAAAMAGCAIFVWRERHGEVDEPPSAEAKSPAEAASAVTLRRRVSWVLYAFIPSSLMLGVTGHITTDIAAVPLIWILPFIGYLLTYILAFSPLNPLPHGVMVRVAPLVLIPLVFFLSAGHVASAWLTIGVHMSAFFVLALVFHGEIARTRPPTSHLTEFYLWLSVGGALGGLFNGLLAPLVFDRHLEYPLVLVVAALALPAWALRQLGFDLGSLGKYVVPAALAVVALAWALDPEMGAIFWATIGGFVLQAIVYLASGRLPRLFGLTFAMVALAAVYLSGVSQRNLVVERSFFGVSRVMETEEVRALYSGVTLHGWQFHDDPRRDNLVGYYAEGSPIWQVFQAFRARPEVEPLAIMGLGTGNLAMFGRPDQALTFYEIDPVVVDIANEYFTYLERSPAEVEVVLGDGRLELAEAPEDHFGLIVMDAFSSDSVPVHLITREAVAMYVERLRDDGILLVHTSNRYLNLNPVIGNIAASLDLVAYENRYQPEISGESIYEKTGSRWVVIARRGEVLAPIVDAPGWKKLEARQDYPVWTDRYSNILSVLQ